MGRIKNATVKWYGLKNIVKYERKRREIKLLEKEKLFSKFNVIDYNEKLEEILERKHFSEEAENLLLSVFYKVQGCYKDYKVVKNNKIKSVRSK